MLSAIGAAIISPSARRSSVRNAMPRSIAACGVGSRRAARRRPRSCPSANGSSPNRMRAISERPEPIRPGDADDLARLHRERDVLDHARLGEPAHLQHRRARAGCRLARRIDLVDRAADHQRDQPVDGHLGLGRAADDMAVAQHGDVVAQAHHVAQDVADVDDADAARPQPADLREQALGLARGERGGGLVEDDDPGVGTQRLGDLDQLPLALAEARHRRARRPRRGRSRPAARARARAPCAGR